MKVLTKNWRYLALLGGLVIAAWLIMDFNNRTAELNRLKSERAYVQGEYEEVFATKSALETVVAFNSSEAAVEKWAYEEGHMLRPGDIPVILIAGTPIVPTPTAQPAVMEPERSNPEAWFALFFGPRAP